MNQFIMKLTAIDPAHAWYTILLAAIVLTGCEGVDYRPDAVGPNHEITVVIDSSHWEGPIGETVRNEIGPYLGTLPAPERAFDFVHMSMASQRAFDQIKKRKNLVFVAPLSDTTNEARFLQNILSEEALQAIMDGGSAVVPRINKWRRNQQVFYVTAATPEALIQTLEDGSAAIRDTFNVAVRQRMQRDMFERGRQPDLEEQLMNEHGFAVNVQHDYRIVADTMNFVWLRRVLPETWRSLFVYYIEGADPSTLSPEWIYATRDSLTKKYVQGTAGGWVQIDRRRPLETQDMDFLGRYGFETRGLWIMANLSEDGTIFPSSGGPFLTYTFYDQESGRIYMIDGMVFAPGYDKREFLRQLEVIAYTFRTKADDMQERQVATTP